MATCERPGRRTPNPRRPMRDFDVAWQRTQFEGGWAGIAWPAEFGGRGLSLIKQMIWTQEYAAAEAPYAGCCNVGLSHGGPTLIARGTATQQAEYLPKILNGDSLWCQGFSEPNAGSDLASLRTSGVIDGDMLVVNGQKSGRVTLSLRTLRNSWCAQILVRSTGASRG